MLASRSLHLVLGAFVALAAGLFLALPSATSRVIAATAAADTVHIGSIADDVLRDPRRPQLTPSFVRAKKRYAFVWNLGEPPHVYVVVAVKDDGWVGIVTSDSPQPEFVTVN